MLQTLTPLVVSCRDRVPARTRPLVRWRREAFGYLAAFPDGHVGIFGDEALSLLRSQALLLWASRGELLARLARKLLP